ncbi:hypothetical protein [Hwangdonia lutea]|uniref:Lipoprotein n=1 Tax=Hwangdonia lutea TaxID=3075823 RepID=A0AA97ELQ1_9FLAO|nr:hypothetical protein [Hwangdonia sp. SCSIO 19198]WOD42845.1 hypothetical protein RNZ46_12680 [Hwangdonia sp. SCSIO 19198]
MKTLKKTFIAFMAVTLVSCTSLYDHFTYTETIQTKLDAISLIDKSDTPYSDSEVQITNLKNQMKKMVIYENGKDKNQLTTKMWELISSEKHLMGSYLKLWEEKESLNTAFKEEAKPQIEEAFNLMIFYEEKKDKQSQNALTQFINQFNL